jgi:hypothetical protein
MSQIQTLLPALRLFTEGFLEQNLLFKNIVAYPSGLVQIGYLTKKGE